MGIQLLKGGLCCKITKNTDFILQCRSGICLFRLPTGNFPLLALAFHGWEHDGFLVNSYQAKSPGCPSSQRRKDRKACPRSERKQIQGASDSVLRSHDFLSISFTMACHGLEAAPAQCMKLTLVSHSPRPWSCHLSRGKMGTVQAGNPRCPENQAGLRLQVFSKGQASTHRVPAPSFFLHTCLGR